MSVEMRKSSFYLSPNKQMFILTLERYSNHSSIAACFFSFSGNGRPLNHVILSCFLCPVLPRETILVTCAIDSQVQSLISRKQGFL